jgi:hypothetical protein
MWCGLYFKHFTLFPESQQPLSAMTVAKGVPLGPPLDSIIIWRIVARSDHYSNDLTIQLS